MTESIAMNVINGTDTAFMGRVGEAELGAVGLGAVWYFLCVAAGIALGSAVQIVVARRLGENKPEAVGEAVDHSLVLGFALGLVILGFIQFAAPWLLQQFIASPAVYGHVRDYLIWRSFDIPVVMLGYALRGFYNGLGRNRIIIANMATVALVNVALNYAFVFGKFGAPALGIRGAALASALAQTAGVAMLFGITIWKGRPKAYDFLRLRRFRRQLFARLADLSGPSAMQYIISMSSFFVFINIIEKRGETELAISNVAQSLYIACMIPIWAFGVASSTFFSNLIGQNKPRAAMISLKRITLNSVLVVSLVSLMMLLIPHNLLSIYTNDRNIIEGGLRIIPIMASSLLIYAAAGVWLHAVMGAGATRYAMFSEIITIVFYIAYVFAVAYGFNGDLRWLWSAEYIYFGVMGLMALRYLASGRWKDKKI